MMNNRRKIAVLGLVLIGAVAGALLGIGASFLEHSGLLEIRVKERLTDLKTCVNERNLDYEECHKRHYEPWIKRVE